MPKGFAQLHTFKFTFDQNTRDGAIIPKTENGLHIRAMEIDQSEAGVN